MDGKTKTNSSCNAGHSALHVSKSLKQCNGFDNKVKFDDETQSLRSRLEAVLKDHRQPNRSKEIQASAGPYKVPDSSTNILMQERSCVHRQRSENTQTSPNIKVLSALKRASEIISASTSDEDIISRTSPRLQRRAAFGHFTRIYETSGEEPLEEPSSTMSKAGNPARKRPLSFSQ